MSDEFTLQCESCGTLYPDTDEVCPYCGQPQPLDRMAYAGPDVIDDFYTEPANAPVMASYTDDYAAEEWAESAPGETGFDEYDPAYTGDEYYADDESLLDEDEAAEFYEDEEEIQAEPRRRVGARVLLGCVGLLACILVFYGGIGLFAAYRGLQERTTEVQTQAEQHYQRGQAHLANNEFELALAEFEMALSLNPNLHAAREGLHEAQRLYQAQPTPTSETRLAAAAALLSQAETQVTQQKWVEAVESLAQVRGLDAGYQAPRVSELLYQASYQLGLQLLAPDTANDALAAFERALTERPTDESALQQKTRAALYVAGKIALEQNDLSKAVDSFRQLYQQDGAYLDIKQHLLNAYAKFGDDLTTRNEWCQAQTQYDAAVLLQPDSQLKAKADESSQRCQQITAAQPAVTPKATLALPKPTVATGEPITVTAPLTAATPITAPTIASGGNKILLAQFNPNEARWEILTVSPTGGAPVMLAANGTMPALSPNGRLLVYHSELIEAEGLHLLDVSSGQDTRLTMFKQHILPRWGGDNTQFLFVAQEAGTGRWQIHQGFADGKGEPIILRDGRTPDLSPDNSLIAFQGADPQGNNPGIYLAPFGGGEATRLTNHESDRAPDFSPDGSQLAYMSTRNGNWDIYTVSVAGSAPRQITSSPGNDGLPAWSPDGAQIAYVSDADGSWAVYVVNGAGGAPVKVTTWAGNQQADWLLAQIGWTR